MTRLRGILLRALPMIITLAMLSCGRGEQALTSDGRGKMQPWPGAYSQANSLKGLKSVALRVYAEKGIPSIPGAAGRSIRDEVDERSRQQLAAAGISLVDGQQADSLLEVSMYLQCQPESSACGYHTTLELRQWAELSRDRNNRIAAITWRNSYTGGVVKIEIAGLPDRLLVDTGTLLGGFLDDYGTANPR